MSLQNRIEKLQKQPYETRLKILWGTVIAAGIILVIVWIFSLKNTLSGVDSKNLLSPAADSSSISRNDLVEIEWVEKSPNSLKIFFNIQNQTPDILNVSRVSDIKLLVNGQTLSPAQMTDRQGGPFIQKALSQTKNFGVLDFNGNFETTQATLIFDKMFFDKNQSDVLKQELKMNLTELNKDGKLRN